VAGTSGIVISTAVVSVPSGISKRFRLLVRLRVSCRTTWAAKVWSSLIVRRGRGLRVSVAHAALLKFNGSTGIQSSNVNIPVKEMQLLLMNWTSPKDEQGLLTHVEPVPEQGLVQAMLFWSLARPRQQPLGNAWLKPKSSGPVPGSV